jgi:hypothetical protein
LNKCSPCFLTGAAAVIENRRSLIIPFCKSAVFLHLSKDETERDWLVKFSRKNEKKGEKKEKY